MYENQYNKSCFRLSTQILFFFSFFCHSSFLLLRSLFLALLSLLLLLIRCSLKAPLVLCHNISGVLQTKMVPQALTRVWQCCYTLTCHSSHFPCPLENERLQTLKTLCMTCWLLCRCLRGTPKLASCFPFSEFWDWILLDCTSPGFSTSHQHSEK